MIKSQMELPVIQPAVLAEGQPPIFARIGIVGLGLIGGSIALAARRLWPKALVIAVDRKDVLETAMRLHAIDVAADDLFVLAEADLVVLAAPVRQNLRLLDQLDDYVRQPAVVTDTGSTKRAMVEAARRLPSRFTFIGGHPLGGAASSGLEHARRTCSMAVPGCSRRRARQPATPSRSSWRSRGRSAPCPGFSAPRPTIGSSRSSAICRSSRRVR
jgi:hypothetical protein